MRVGLIKEIDKLMETSVHELDTERVLTDPYLRGYHNGIIKAVFLIKKLIAQ